MRHTTRTEGMIEGLLRATRTIAVIGGSPRPARHSHAVAPGVARPRRPRARPDVHQERCIMEDHRTWPARSRSLRRAIPESRACMHGTAVVRPIATRSMPQMQGISKAAEVDRGLAKENARCSTKRKWRAERDESVTRDTGAIAYFGSRFDGSRRLRHRLPVCVQLSHLCRALRVP